MGWLPSEAGKSLFPKEIGSGESGFLAKKRVNFKKKGPKPTQVSGLFKK